MSYRTNENNVLFLETSYGPPLVEKLQQLLIVFWNINLSLQVMYDSQLSISNQEIDVYYFDLHDEHTS